MNSVTTNIELGTYQMYDDSIIVVTGIINQEVAVAEQNDSVMLVPRSLDDDDRLVVFRSVEKHPFPDNLQYMTAKMFRKQVSINGKVKQFAVKI